MKKINSKIRVKQLDFTDCGAACLASIGAFYGHTKPISVIRTEAGTDKNGTSLLGMVRAAEKIGFISQAVNIKDKKLLKEDLPAIAHLKIREVWFHFVVVYSIYDKYYLVMDPATGKIEKVEKTKFEKDWTGILLILRPGEKFKIEQNYIPVSRRIKSIIRPHRKDLLKVMVGAFIYSGLGIATALYIETLTDSIIPKGEISILSLTSILLLLIILLRVITGYLKNILLLKTGKKIDSRLIDDYHKHLLELPIGFFQSMKKGEIISRISDAIKIRSFINSIVQEISVYTIIVIISMSMMFIYSPLLTSIVLLSIPFYLLLYRFLNKVNKKYLRKTMEFGAEMESQLVETIGGINSIKSFNSELIFNNRLYKRREDLLESIFKTSKFYSVTSSGSELVSGLGLLLVLWLGAYLVMMKKISFGELFSFYSLYTYMAGPLVNLILSNRSIQDAKIAAERLFQVMDLEVEMNRSYDNSTSLHADNISVKISNLKFSYPGKMDLLRNISFSCAPGSINAIVGESGSGKSTIISLLLGFNRPENGDILFNEVSHTNMSTSTQRSFISYVPQEVKLFSGTIAQNITLMQNDFDEHNMTRCLKLSGLTGVIKNLPHGINTYITEDGNNFSGGEKQKIALARALYKNSPFIVLDEPSSAMDIYSEQHLMSLLQNLRNEGRTILIAAHKLSMISQADQIIVLEKGKVGEKGKHEDLLLKDGHYSKIWRYQNQQKFYA